MALRISDQKMRSENGGMLSRRTKVDLMCFLVIILVGTFFFMKDGSADMLTWDDTQIVLTMPDETVHTIPYAEITQVVLVDDADFGVCLTGSDTRNQRYGIWLNDLLGEYVLYAGNKAATVMQISTAEEDYWISFENSDTTMAFTDAFIEMLTDAGYDVR